MRPTIGILLALAMVSILLQARCAYGCAQASEAQTASATSSSAKLTNNDILEMTKAGLSAEIIIAKIQASACSFDTSPAALKELKSAGVPEAVILAIVKSSASKPSVPPIQFPPAQQANRENWSPVVETDGQLFPALMLATANMKPPKKNPNRLGDPLGTLGVAIQSIAPNTRVRVSVAVEGLIAP